MGSIQLDLNLTAPAPISRASYQITSPSFSKTGAFDIPAPPLTSILIGELPSGDAYAVTLAAASADGSIACSGSTSFSVQAATVTPVPVRLECGSIAAEGSVIVEGTVEVCPSIDAFSVSPLVTNAGSPISLVASVSGGDRGPSSLRTSWSATYGVLTAPFSQQATLVCPQAGAATVTLTVTDGGCTLRQQATVTCLCATASDCPGSDSHCLRRKCAAGACGVQIVAAGTPSGNASAGGCHQYQCDGAGNEVLVVDDANVPDDRNPCTSDACAGGVPSNANVPAGSPCDGNQQCDGRGTCWPGTLRAVRVGDGAAPLSSSASPVFLDEYRVDGTPVKSVPMPIAASGANQAFVLGGTDADVGGLTISGDGRFSVLVGYATGPGLSNLRGTSPSAVPRAVARVGRAGGVDTSTILDGSFPAPTIRGAASADGSGFWLASADGTVSVGYVPFGTTGGAPLVTSPGAATSVGVAAGDLYGVSAVAPYTNVFRIGAGMPAAGAQPANSLPGFPTTGASPAAFAAFDLDASVSGIDVVYVADARDPSLGGGIQRWVLAGGTWTLKTTLNVAQNPAGFRGLGGLRWGTAVRLFGTTADASSQRIVVVEDDGSTTPVVSVVATAPANEAFRGVAPSPHD